MITMSLNDWQLIWLAFHVGFIVSRQRYWEAIKTNKRKRKIRFTLYAKETTKRFGQAEKALRKNYYIKNGSRRTWQSQILQSVSEFQRLSARMGMSKRTDLSTMKQVLENQAQRDVALQQPVRSPLIQLTWLHQAQGKQKKFAGCSHESRNFAR